MLKHVISHSGVQATIKVVEIIMQIAADYVTLVDLPVLAI